MRPNAAPGTIFKAVSEVARNIGRRFTARIRETQSYCRKHAVLQAPGGTEHLIVLEVCYERVSVKQFREPPDEGERWPLKIPGPVKDSL